MHWPGWNSTVFVSTFYRGGYGVFCFWREGADKMAGQSWQAAWAFELVGCVFLLWMMIMAYQVYAEDS
jgi:hypothetical protein